MSALTLKAPAKLNLHLGIHAELDERRYHKAESLMVALDIADEVTVEERASASGVHLTCKPPIRVATQDNTAYRAAIALGTRVGIQPNVTIHLDKRVPDQAGMGGSSSDAGAVLRALCGLWGIDVRDERVAEAARAVGADVPFFLNPVPTLLVGAGDVVAELFPPFEDPIPVVLVRPSGAGVSTAKAYAAFDEAHDEPKDPEALCELLRTGHATGEQIAPLLSNNLDPVACRLLPAVADVGAWLLDQHGILGGQVTGSGSCVFGICESRERARAIAMEARVKFGGWTKNAHIVGGIC